MDDDATNPERWLGYMVEPGRRFVGVTIEGIGESFTPDQARGIAKALEEAADEVEEN